MCGDLEEDDTAGAQAFEGFRQHAARLTAEADARGRGADAENVNAYLDRLFADILARIADDEQAPGIAGYHRLSLTPIVLARLAGLLSGHVALAEDPLRRALEALMLGYGEPEALFRAQHDHHHDHHHHHGEHGHSH